MNILILSDLHLESAKFTSCVDAEADVVVLAGDIAPGQRGILWALETFKTLEIVYVAGNHEFYCRIAAPSNDLQRYRLWGHIRTSVLSRVMKWWNSAARACAPIRK